MGSNFWSISTQLKSYWEEETNNVCSVRANNDIVNSSTGNATCKVMKAAVCQKSIEKTYEQYIKRVEISDSAPQSYSADKRVSRHEEAQWDDFDHIYDAMTCDNDNYYWQCWWNHRRPSIYNDMKAICDPVLHLSRKNCDDHLCSIIDWWEVVSLWRNVWVIYC